MRKRSPRMVKVEACIRGDLVEDTGRFSRAAFAGGADTIELCASMDLDGLTPPRGCIEAARSVFLRPGLMVMIRPRGGDFCYTNDEILEMTRQIEVAAATGADGVVFGALTRDAKIEEQHAERLIELSHALNLKATFHRAFDAVKDVHHSLDLLIQLGIDRILTSGVAWGKPGSALDGVTLLNQCVQRCAEKAEIVIGGGVSPENAPLILKELEPWKGSLSVHAYSGVMEDGETTETRVRSLVESTSPW